MTHECPKVSACIVSFNEEERIADCIASVAWCDEILVVDSHSTDRTREIASSLGARVVERAWPGMVQQREFSIREARHDWVLCIDCDERASGRLKDEILALRDSGFPTHAGWRFPRCSNYLGRWIRHGTWYPDRTLRFLDRRRGKSGGRDPHDHIELTGSCGDLKGELYHFPYRSISDHLRRIDNYTTIMAKGMNERGRRAGAFDLWIKPAAHFVNFYFFRRAFLDGWRGILLACLSAQYVQLKYAKLKALQSNVAPGPTPD